MTIKKENFFTIMGWMITDLKLSGTDLFIYAIIYGFSQDEGSVFSGSRAYLAAWCNASISTVKRSLKSLQDRGLIEQVYHSVDNTEVHYKAYTCPRFKMTQGMGQNEPSLGSNCQGAGFKMTQAIKDNTEDNIANNIADNIVVCETPTRPRFKKPTREEVKEYSLTRATNGVDPDRFFDYYEANGWKVGKNPMKDWQAAFRNWERAERTKKQVKPTKAENVPYMQNEYSKEHLEQREADSLRVLDDLLGEEGGQ